MRKLFLLFWALLTTTCLWAHDFEVDGIYYNYLDGNNVEVTYRGNYADNYNNEYSGAVTIPETVTYNGTTYNVTSIGGWAFYRCSSLTSVTIPHSVTSIGSSAFYECSSLTKTNYTGDIASWCDIKFGDFYANPMSYSHNFYINDQEIKNLVIPNTVDSIHDYAFWNCSSLTSITIPNSVTRIGDNAFRNCSALTSPVYNAHCFAYLPPSFEGTYTVPDGIKQIAGGAFSSCSSLTSVIIPNSVTSIGENAFYYCRYLTSITIPNSVTSIGDYAFQYCSSLTSVTIPNSVTSIGNYAFSKCTALTSVTIGSGVTSIGNDAFYSCSALKSIVWNARNCADASSLEAAPFYGITSQIKSFTFGEAVEHVPAYLCYGMDKLTSVIIPNNVKSIGRSAFEHCSSLTSITCGAETPPTIGSYVFYGVSKSIPVFVPCGCVDVYKNKGGWNDFTNIQEPVAEYSIEVNVNDTIMGSAKVDYNTFCEGAQISATPNIGYHFVQWSDGNTDNPRTLALIQDTILTAEFAQSFSGQCGDNLYWNYDETTKTISITGSGKMYDYTATTQPWLLFKEQIVEVTTTNTVTSIGTSAFEGCVRLGKISLGTGLEEIAANAFANCRRLYEIYSYASLPPLAETSSFTNYNATLYVPCTHKQYYQSDMVFILFIKIECIGAESEPVVPDTVIVTPGSNDVTITWPTDPNAETYVIVIKQGDKVFCSLTFNADGQLLNIAFAPSRSGSHPVTYAASTGNGLRFTVTSLDAATTYGYNVTTKDEEDNTLSTYTGEFTTKGGTTTAVEDVLQNTTNTQKLLRDGQLLILKDGKTYNAMGQEM